MRIYWASGDKIIINKTNGKIAETFFLYIECGATIDAANGILFGTEAFNMIVINKYVVQYLHEPNDACRLHETPFNNYIRPNRNVLCDALPAAAADMVCFVSHRTQMEHRQRPPPLAISSERRSSNRSNWMLSSWNIVVYIFSFNGIAANRCINSIAYYLFWRKSKRCCEKRIWHWINDVTV